MLDHQGAPDIRTMPTCYELVINGLKVQFVDITREHAPDGVDLAFMRRGALAPMGTAAMPAGAAVLLVDPATADMLRQYCADAIAAARAKHGLRAH